MAKEGKEEWLRKESKNDKEMKGRMTKEWKEEWLKNEKNND